MKLRVSLAFALCVVIVSVIAYQTWDSGIKVALIGDSTVSDEGGWGRAFASSVGPGVTVINFAINGSSSKSWYDKGRVERVIDASPNVALIQFGHNDTPGNGPDRETDFATTYKEYLSRYIHDLRLEGIQPVLISPLAPRKFDEQGNLPLILDDYADAMRDVALRQRAPYIDLHALTFAHYSSVGQKSSMAYNQTETDTTHINAKGAQLAAGFILDKLEQVAPDLYLQLFE